MKKVLNKISVLLALTLCINLIDTVTLQPYLVKANEPNTEISFSRGGNVSISNIDSQNSFKLLVTGDNLSNTEFVHRNWVYKVKKFDYTTQSSYQYACGTRQVERQGSCKTVCAEVDYNHCYSWYCGGDWHNANDGNAYDTGNSCGSKTCSSYRCKRQEQQCSTVYETVTDYCTGYNSNSHTLLPANITVNQATNTFSLPSSGTVTMKRVRKHEIPVKLKFDVEGIKELTVNGNPLTKAFNEIDIDKNTDVVIKLGNVVLWEGRSVLDEQSRQKYLEGNATTEAKDTYGIDITLNSNSDNSEQTFVLATSISTDIDRLLGTANRTPFTREFTVYAEFNDKSTYKQTKTSADRVEWQADFSGYVFEEDNIFLKDGETTIESLIRNGKLESTDKTKLTPFTHELLGKYYILSDIVRDTNSISTLEDENGQKIAEVKVTNSYGNKIAKVKDTEQVLTGVEDFEVIPTSELLNKVDSNVAIETDIKTNDSIRTIVKPTVDTTYTVYDVYLSDGLLTKPLNMDGVTSEIRLDDNNKRIERRYRVPNTELTVGGRGTHEHNGKQYAQVYGGIFENEIPTHTIGTDEKVHSLGGANKTLQGIDSGTHKSIFFYYTPNADYTPDSYTNFPVYDKFLQDDEVTTEDVKRPYEYILKKGDTVSLSEVNSYKGKNYVIDVMSTTTDKPNNFVAPNDSRSINIQYREAVPVRIIDEKNDLETGQVTITERTEYFGLNSEYTVHALDKTSGYKLRKGKQYKDSYTGIAFKDPVPTVKFFYNKIAMKQIKVVEHFTRVPDPENPSNANMAEDREVESNIELELDEPFTHEANDYPNYDIVGDRVVSGITTRDTEIRHEYIGQTVTANVTTNITDEKTGQVESTTKQIRYFKGLETREKVKLDWGDDLELTEYRVGVDGTYHELSDNTHSGEYVFTPTENFDVTINLLKPIDSPYITENGVRKARVRVVRQFDDKEAESVVEYHPVGQTYTIGPTEIPHYRKAQTTVTKTGTLTRPIRIVFSYERIKHLIRVVDSILDEETNEREDIERISVETPEGNSYHYEESDRSDIELIDKTEFEGIVTQAETFTFHYRLIKDKLAKDNPKYKEIDGVMHGRVVVRNVFDDKEAESTVKYFPLGEEYEVSPKEIRHYITTDTKVTKTLEKAETVTFHYNRIKHEFKIYDKVIREEDGSVVSNALRLTENRSEGDSYMYEALMNDETHEFLNPKNGVFDGPVTEPTELVFEYMIHKVPPYKTIDGKRFVRVYVYDKTNNRTEKRTEYIEYDVNTLLKPMDITGYRKPSDRWIAAVKPIEIEFIHGYIPPFYYEEPDTTKPVENKKQPTMEEKREDDKDKEIEKGDKPQSDLDKLKKENAVIKKENQSLKNAITDIERKFKEKISSLTSDKTVDIKIIRYLPTGEIKIETLTVQNKDSVKIDDELDGARLTDTQISEDGSEIHLFYERIPLSKANTKEKVKRNKKANDTIAESGKSNKNAIKLSVESEVESENKEIGSEVGRRETSPVRIRMKGNQVITLTSNNVDTGTKVVRKTDKAEKETEQDHTTHTTKSSVFVPTTEKESFATKVKKSSVHAKKENIEELEEKKTKWVTFFATMVGIITLLVILMSLIGRLRKKR